MERGGVRREGGVVEGQGRKKGRRDQRSQTEEVLERPIPDVTKPAGKSLRASARTSRTRFAAKEIPPREDAQEDAQEDKDGSIPAYQ